MSSFNSVLLLAIVLFFGEFLHAQCDNFDNGIPSSYRFTTVKHVEKTDTEAAFPRYRDVDTDVSVSGENGAETVVIYPAATNTDFASVSPVSVGTQTVYGSVTVPRVYSGSGAVRINHKGILGVAGNLTTMSKDFVVSAAAVTFNYSVIFHRISVSPHPGTNGQPFFRARVYSGSVHEDLFVQADNTNPALTQVLVSPPSTTNVMLYSGWTTGTLSLSKFIPGQTVTLEFVAAYCNNDATQHSGVVFIDDVCTGCDATLNETVDLVAGTIEQQRSDWIKCENELGTDVYAIYHAGNFVELNPGFEVKIGGSFSAYIEGCTNSFVYRPVEDATPDQVVLPTKSGFSLYPNPSNSLTTVVCEQDMKRIVVSSIDGKQIMAIPASGHEREIDVSRFSNGIYLISVETADGQLLTEKFVKN